MANDLHFSNQKLAVKVLLFSTFIISVCGLSYELLIGSLSTNLEGNAVLQYSLTIGFFMSALGIGSYLSRFIVSKLLLRFIAIEIILGIVGGLSIPLLNLVYIELYPVYPVFNILLLTIIGTLVGLEIPIITRILKEFDDLKETLSNVLTLDYIGGLAASLIFPLILYPYIGLIKTAFIVGLLNLAIGLVNLVVFSPNLKTSEKQPLWLASLVTLLVLTGGIVFSSQITGYYSKAIYGTVLYNKQSRYQKIILTQTKGNTELYLDGQLQFSSIYEYRYHEALIFPAFYLKKNIETVLIMGGGDGLGVRQLLKFPHIKKIILVDLDPKMTNLAKNFSILRRINQDAFHHPKVEVLNQDAYKYLGTTPYDFDVIYADFPDPHDAALAKLYSHEFYHFVKRKLKKDGILITQATSPFYAKKTFRCIGKTLESVFKTVKPYHVNVPDMGDWGFFIAFNKNSSNITEILKENFTRDWKNVPIDFFTKQAFINSLFFPKDTQLKKDEEVRVNYFTEPIIYKYFLEGWKHFYQN